MLKWIADNWNEVWGHGLKVNGEKIDFYVTVPVDLIMKELGVTFDEVRGREVPSLPSLDSLIPTTWTE